MKQLRSAGAGTRGSPVPFRPRRGVDPGRRPRSLSRPSAQAPGAEGSPGHVRSRRRVPRARPGVAPRLPRHCSPTPRLRPSARRVLSSAGAQSTRRMVQNTWQQVPSIVDSIFKSLMGIRQALIILTRLERLNEEARSSNPPFGGGCCLKTDESS